MDRTPLPGDLIGVLLGPRKLSGDPLSERERGSLDPQTIAEFLAFDVPVDVEPAVGFLFPPEGPHA